MCVYACVFMRVYMFIHVCLCVCVHAWSIFLYIQLSCLLLIAEYHTICKTHGSLQTVSSSLITRVKKGKHCIQHKTILFLSFVLFVDSSMHTSLLCVSFENLQMFVTYRMMSLVVVAVHVASKVGLDCVTAIPVQSP